MTTIKKILENKAEPMDAKNKRFLTIKAVWTLLNSIERRKAAFLLMLMTIGMMLETLGIGLIIPTLALMTQDDFGKSYPTLQPLLDLAGNPSQESLIVMGMLSLVVIYLIKSLFIGFLVWRQYHFAFGVQAQLSQRLFATYLRQPYAFHIQRNSAQLIHNTISEISQFTNRALIPMLQIFSEGIVLFGIAVLLIIIEPIGALIVSLTLLGAACGFHYFTRGIIFRWGEERVHHEGLRLQHLQQGLGGVKDVILLGRENNFLDQYWKHNSNSARIGQYVTTMAQLPRLWLELLAVGGLAILVLTMVSQNNSIESIVPAVGLFAAAAFRLMPSAYRMLGAVQNLRFAESIIEILQKELNISLSKESGIQDTNSNCMLQKQIEVSNITYFYPDTKKPSLNDFSIIINKGESVGFVGSSGSGKSTLIDCILGLLHPEHGEIKVDGEKIGKNLRAWQNQIGYVPQTIYLTDDNLRRNVAFGLSNEQIDKDAVLRAISAAQLDVFVQSLPDGLDTIVGEHGVRLSGGQRQRIGIARALYHDPDVLVLDEATSALDSQTEKDVMRAITALQRSKTILIVAHRLSTLEACDQIYTLEGGRIIKDRTPV